MISLTTLNSAATILPRNIQHWLIKWCVAFWSIESTVGRDIVIHFSPPNQFPPAFCLKLLQNTIPWHQHLLHLLQGGVLLFQTGFIHFNALTTTDSNFGRDMALETDSFISELLNLNNWIKKLNLNSIIWKLLFLSGSKLNLNCKNWEWIVRSECGSIWRVESSVRIKHNFRATQLYFTILHSVSNQ